jgi:pectinesterase
VQVRPEGWHNWGKVENEKTARYAEYKNTGPGAITTNRAPWAVQLTDEAAKAYTAENILAGADGWTPRVGN